MALEKLMSQLKELEEKIAETRAERDEYNNRVRELSAKIRELRKSIAERREALKSLREEYSKVVEEFNEYRNRKNSLKEVLKGLRAERREVINEMRKLRAKVRNIDEKNERELRSKLEALEWEYQTKSLSSEEEKIYVNKINELLEQIAVIEKYKRLQDRLNDIEAELEKIRTEYEEILSKLSELYKKRNEMRENIGALKNEISNIRNIIDDLRRTRDETKKRADEKHQQLIQMLTKRKELLKEIEKEQLLRKAQIIAKTIADRRKELEKKAVHIKEKIKRGERITFEEFKILVELGEVPLR
ncbi:MAG: hypothetical protein DRJ52_00515 [Thermoprotei archaeon]|nr:MAG: hypothetical protein DRJ52_00515 [Thermoprotei archaeon]RLF00498.1 MAG: hypothetical protein DRJ63_02315 [Thermoprotei archaeon]HDI74424.1 hypothetical protein [Thermoprotei archaeon]